MSDSADRHHPPHPPSPGMSSCCCSCFNSCFPGDGKKKFAGVEYSAVPTNGEGMVVEGLPMPKIKKSFSLPQGKTECAIPLQLSHHEWAGAKKTVTRQPKHSRSFSEPSLPPGYIPDPNMFDLRNTTGATSSLGRLRSASERRSASPRNSPPSLTSSTQSLPPSVFSERQLTLQPHHHHHNIHYEREDSSGSWKPTLSSIADVEETEEKREVGGERGGERERRRTVRNGSDSPPTPPNIEFSLYYDIQCRTLTVHLQCVSHLSVRNRKAGVSPIVLLYLLPNREDIFQSKMVENSTNPKFDQSFEFSGLLPDEIRRQTLIFRIFSHSSKGDLLGGLGVLLSEADLFGVMCRRNIDTDMEKLKLVSRGDLLLSLTYSPATQKLQGLLLKATNLQKQDIVGLADPYVKIWLLKKGRRNQKWKSKVKRNTLIPIFNEPFQFDLSEMSVKEVTLEILMMDYDRFSRNDLVGVVYIGERVPHDTGRQHWERLLSQPDTSISSWHTILPLTARIERTTRKKKVSSTISSRYNGKDDD